MNITKDELKQIKDKLYPGALEEIAKNTGYDVVHVGRILNGISSLNHNNSKIIEEAVKLIEKAQKKEDKLKEKIKAI